MNTVASLPAKWREEAAPSVGSRQENDAGSAYDDALERCADELEAALATPAVEGGIGDATMRWLRAEIDAVNRIIEDPQPLRDGLVLNPEVSERRDRLEEIERRLATAEHPGSAVQGEKLAWALEQGGILADWCNVAGDALRELMAAYKRRVRSACTTDADLASEPWRCAEYVQAEQAIKVKPSPTVEITTPPPAPAAEQEK